MIKNYFRILKKPHAYLHTILKTPVKFQKDWTETVGGVKGTKYPLKTRNHAPRTTHHAPRTTHHAPRTTRHAPRTTHHAPRKTKNSVPPLFFEKAGDKKKSHGTRSGEYEVWGKTVTFSFFKNAVTIAEVWAGALSCRRRTCSKPVAGRRFW